MKYRCPYCKHEFAGQLHAICPQCGKTMYIPDNVQRLPARERRRILKRLARDAERQRMRMVSPAVKLGQRPMAAVLVLGLMLLAGGSLLMKVRHPGFRLSPKPTPLTAAREDLQVLKVVLEEFRKDCGRYPRADEGLEALMHNPGTPLWKGPYLNVLKSDPWKHRYSYLFQDDRLLIRSSGPDGDPDTGDDLYATIGVAVTNAPTPSSPKPDESGGQS